MLGPAGRWVTMNFRKITKFDWTMFNCPRVAGESIQSRGMPGVLRRIQTSAGSVGIVSYFCSMEAQKLIMSIGESIPSIKVLAESDAFLKSDLNPKRNDMFLNPDQYQPNSSSSR